MKLTTIPDDEWATVEAAAREFWDEIAAESETKAKVVEIFKQYNADMEKAGRPTATPDGNNNRGGRIRAPPHPFKNGATHMPAH